jgi:hypothetical protein
MLVLVVLDPLIDLAANTITTYGGDAGGSPFAQLHVMISFASVRQLPISNGIPLAMLRDTRRPRQE